MKKNRNYLFFITPGFVVYTIFAIIPILYVVYLAFTNYTGMGKADFVGFENFIRIFNDERFTPAFFNSLKNNLKYLLCVWFIITPFQYFLAYFFFIKIPAYKYIKFMVFLPYVISSTVILDGAPIEFISRFDFRCRWIEVHSIMRLKASI